MNLALRTCEAVTTLTVFIRLSKLYAACLSFSEKVQMYNWGRVGSSSSLLHQGDLSFSDLTSQRQNWSLEYLRQTTSRSSDIYSPQVLEATPSTAFWKLAVGKLKRCRPSVFLICLKKRKGVQHLIVCLSSTLARKCLFASNWPWETVERLGLTEGLAGDV